MEGGRGRSGGRRVGEGGIGWILGFFYFFGEFVNEEGEYVEGF